MEDNDNKFKIICQYCNVFVTRSERSEELPNITFLHARISTLGLYPEELVPENYHFRWPDRTKTQCINQRLLKEDNGYHKYLSCTDI